MAKPPVSMRLPKLRRGEGSWDWRPDRAQPLGLRFVVDGRQHLVSGRSPGECFARREERKAELAAEHQPTTTVAGKTVAELVAHWLPLASEGKAPSTVKGYERTAELVNAALGTRPADTVAEGDLEDFLFALVKERDYRTGTLSKRRTHLSMMFAHGARRRWVIANPVPKMQTLKVKKKDRKAVWLDETEFDMMRRYLNANPSTINTVFLLMLLTGLRPGEALGLCWDAVDEKSGTIAVRTAMQSTERRQHLVEELKTEQSNRTVQLPPDLLRALRRERVDQAARRLQARHWVESPLVFTEGDGRFVLLDRLHYACHQACRIVGVKRLTPNGFRHSNASMLLALGAMHEEVAKHLGHKNATQVIRTYGHPMKKVFPVAALLGGV